MLIKAINLNLKIVQNDMITTALLVGLSIVLRDIFPLAIVAIIFLKGYCKLYCSSIYEDEGSLYMTLPISNEINIWGKILACVVWSMFLIGASLVTLAVVFILTSEGEFLISDFSMRLLDFKLTPLQGAIYVSLIPLAIVIFTCFICFFILTMQTGARNLRNKGYVVVVAMILCGIISGGLNKVIDLSTDHGTDFFYMQIGLHLLYIGLIGIMYNYC